MVDPTRDNLMYGVLSDKRRQAGLVLTLEDGWGRWSTVMSVQMHEVGSGRRITLEHRQVKWDALGRSSLQEAHQI